MPGSTWAATPPEDRFDAMVEAVTSLLGALTASLAGRLTLRADDPAGRTPGHPVLLPERPRAADVDLLRLAVAVPGYQRDQVDAVLDRLAAELDARDARVAEVEAQLAASSGPTSGSTGGDA